MPGTELRPTDVLASALGNALTALDVSICFPHAQEAGLDCTQSKVDRKLAHYGPHCPPFPTQNIDHVPVVWSACNRLHSKHVDRPSCALSASGFRAGETWPWSRRSSNASTPGSRSRSGGVLPGRFALAGPRRSSPPTYCVASAAQAGQRSSFCAGPRARHSLPSSLVASPGGTSAWSCLATCSLACSLARQLVAGPLGAPASLLCSGTMFTTEQFLEIVWCLHFHAVRGHSCGTRSSSVEFFLEWGERTLLKECLSKSAQSPIRDHNKRLACASAS